MTKLVNEIHTNWNEHLYTVMFAYTISFKVGRGHIPFQLVYRLHKSMPIEYLLPMTNFATFQDFAMTWACEATFVPLLSVLQGDYA